jgi:hypothetical protein
MRGPYRPRLPENVPILRLEFVLVRQDTRAGIPIPYPEVGMLLKFSCCLTQQQKQTIVKQRTDHDFEKPLFCREKQEKISLVAR